MPDTTVATQYNVLTVNLIVLFVLSCLNYFAILHFAVLTDTGLNYYYYYHYCCCNYVGEQNSLLCQITAETGSRTKRNILIELLLCCGLDI
jgi:hypothetical protein